MAIAFFDYDKTLLAVNSAWLWLKREVRQGHITRWQLAQASLWLVRYHLGSVSLEDTLTRVIGTLAGSEVSHIRERTAEFFHAEVRGRYRPGARKALEQHRAQGDRLVMLTASSVYLAELAGAELGMDHVLCNRFEVDTDGRHTGRCLGALCFGRGKLTHAEEYARSVGEPLEASVFYTDSYADLPVLRAVGRAVAVNPDPRLRREAMRRGWPIVDWGHPSEALAEEPLGSTVP
jgi:HAD superfamily hydrolase (TIGR01490 family)